MSRISLNMEILTTKHFNIYYRPHHHAHPYSISYPKVHKPNNPGRPIISGCDSPTDRLFSFINTYLKPLCNSLPSYIKDANHFLQTIFNLPMQLPPNTILATIDVKSLYTNIGHDEGIHATVEALDTTLQSHTPISRTYTQRKLFHIQRSTVLTETWHCHGHQNGTLICKYLHGRIREITSFICTRTSHTPPVEMIHR